MMIPQQIPIASIAFEGDARLECLQILSVDRLFSTDEVPEYSIVLNGKDNDSLRHFFDEFIAAKVSPALREKITFLRFADLLPTSEPQGYYDQQALKLALAPYYRTKLGAPLYLMLDAKNHFVTKSSFENFFEGGKPRSTLRETLPYWAGYVEKSLNALGIPLEKGAEMIPSVTPYIMYTDIVCELIEGLTSAAEPDLLKTIESSRGTEFLLYYAQLHKSDALGRYDLSGVPAVTLFTNWPQDEVDVLRMLNQLEDKSAVVFGLHRNRLPQLSAEQIGTISKLWGRELLHTDEDASWFFGEGLDKFGGNALTAAGASVPIEVESIPTAERRGAVIPDSAFVAESAALVADVHKRVKLEREVSVGKDCELKGDIWVGDRTEVGAKARISGAVRIGRDVVIESSVLISGDVQIGDRTHLGAGARLIGPISVGKDVEIGPESVLNARSLVVGPANRRSLQTKEAQIILHDGSSIAGDSRVVGSSSVGAGSVIHEGATFCGNLPPDSEWKLQECGGWILSTLTSDHALSVDLKSAGPFGHDAPVSHVTSLDAVSSELGVSRYRIRLQDSSLLDFLLRRTDSEELIVSLHGATDRLKYSLPRFEWYGTLTSMRSSALFLADPALYSHPDIQLGWYLGTRNFDLHAYLADMVQTVAGKIGARRIVISGLSGGGFAALQVSSMIPGSTALVYNPRTEIPIYVKGGEISWPFHSFLVNVMPELAPSRASRDAYDAEWQSELGDRVSARQRYASPTENSVVYMSNVNDPFHALEFLPFQLGVHEGNAVKYRVYEGEAGHRQPSRDQMRCAIEEVFHAQRE